METQNIGDIIRNLAKGGEQIYSLPCEVTAVNGNFADLKPLIGDAEIFDVKITAGDSNTPLLITPVIGSTVIATFLSKDTAFISLYSEIESMQLRGSQFGGLVKVQDLVGKLNDVENKLNDLITKFNSHIHITTATIGGSPTPGTIAPVTVKETPIAPITTVSDLENPEVLHG